MHGPGGPDKDAEIERLLLSEVEEDVIAGLAMVVKEYQAPVFRNLKHKYPGLVEWELLEICANFPGELLIHIKADKLKETGSVKGLSFTIADRDAIDCLRRRNRWKHFLRVTRPTEEVLVRFDDRHDSAELLAVISEFADVALDHQEQLVLRTYVRLVCKGYATVTGRLPLQLLTNEVNHSIKSARLSKKHVHALHRRAKNRLRDYLRQKGLFDE